VETEIGPGEALPGGGGRAMAGLSPDFAAPIVAVVRRSRGGGSASGEASGRRRSGWAKDFRSEMAGTVLTVVSMGVAHRRLNPRLGAA
jgi:hypothetical protein